MFQATCRPHRISPRNRVMFFMLWLRSYPSYNLLSLLFDISVTTVHDELNWFIPVMWEKFHALVQWPTLAEWTEKIGNWNKLLAAVGAIDNLSTPNRSPRILFFRTQTFPHNTHPSHC